MSNPVAPAKRPQFPSILTEQQLISIDNIHSDLGVSRRLALLMLSRDSEQLITGFGSTFADDDGEVLSETIQSLNEFQSRTEAMHEIADAACARILVVAEYILTGAEQ